MKHLAEELLNYFNYLKDPIGQRLAGLLEPSFHWIQLWTVVQQSSHVDSFGPLDGLAAVPPGSVHDQHNLIIQIHLPRLPQKHLEATTIEVLRVEAIAVCDYQFDRCVDPDPPIPASDYPGRTVTLG